MKTWRERIAEARERGWFTGEDIVLAKDWATCAVGECRARFGVGASLVDQEFHPIIPNAVLARAGTQFLVAVRWNQFNDADRLLDAIEDRALQLKREHAG